MKWTTRKTEQQKNIDIIEAAVVSAGFLCFLLYGCIIESVYVVFTDFLMLGVILYTSYKISEYRKRVEKYRKGVLKLGDLYEGSHIDENTRS